MLITAAHELLQTWMNELLQINVQKCMLLDHSQAYMHYRKQKFPLFNVFPVNKKSKCQVVCFVADNTP